MVWDGSDWILNDLCLTQIINQIEKLKDYYEEEFEEAKKNKNFKDVINKLMKYINRYYDGDEDGNINQDFIDLVNKHLKEYLYNNRNIPKNNFSKIKNDIVLKNEKLITTIETK